jgi:hypothetical protein
MSSSGGGRAGGEREIELDADLVRTTITDGATGRSESWTICGPCNNGRHYACRGPSVDCSCNDSYHHRGDTL